MTQVDPELSDKARVQRLCSMSMRQVVVALEMEKQMSAVLGANN